jgi:tetratricopeptide (TPR) repeat protein
VHYERGDYGIAHVADCRILPGKKLYTFGTSEYGALCAHLLTDDDTQFAEIQSGRFATQGIWEFLAPFEEVRWTEYWLPEHGMGGWVCANEEALLNLKQTARGIHVGVLSTREEPTAQLLLMVDDELCWQSVMPLDPQRPACFEISTPAEWLKSIITLVLRCPRHTDEIIRHVNWPGRTGTEDDHNTVAAQGQISEDETSLSAEGHCVKGSDHLRRLEHKAARESFAAALGTDQGFSLAHIGLGLLDYRSGYYQSAQDHFERAVARDHHSVEAWQYLGLARWKAEDLWGAEEALWVAAGQQPAASPASTLLRRLGTEGYYAAGPLPLDSDPASIRRGAAIHRAPHEGGFFGDERHESLITYARGDPELWLEESLTDHRSEGIRTLRLALECCPGAVRYPLVHYYLAHWHELAGRQAASDQAHESAMQCVLAHCFPSRLEELEILGSAVARRPRDWKARYLLGVLLASLDRWVEAISQWRAARHVAGTLQVNVEADAHDVAVLHRNLGLGAFCAEDDFPEAIDCYRKAIEFYPCDARYYLELLRIYRERADKSPEEQLALLMGAPGEIRNNWQIMAHIVECLIALQRHDQALALMETHRFFPVKSPVDVHDAIHMREAWAACLAARASVASGAGDHHTALADLEAAMHYPRNLGEAKPARTKDAMIYHLAAREAGLAGETERQSRYQSLAEEAGLGTEEAAVLWRVTLLRATGRYGEAARVRQAFSGFGGRTAEQPL